MFQKGLCSWVQPKGYGHTPLCSKLEWSVQSSHLAEVVAWRQGHAARVSTRHVEPNHGPGLCIWFNSARKEIETRFKIRTPSLQEADVADQGTLTERHCDRAFLFLSAGQIKLQS